MSSSRSLPMCIAFSTWETHGATRKLDARVLLQTFGQRVRIESGMLPYIRANRFAHLERLLPTALFFEQRSHAFRAEALDKVTIAFTGKAELTAGLDERGMY